METKRKLTESEIDNICETVISSSISIPDDISKSILQNKQRKLKKQLSNISIYPKMIPHLIKEVAKQYQKTIVQPGESVGIICAQSIGERQTQLSVHADEEVIIQKNGTIFEGKISDFIDELIDENKGYKTIDLLEHKDSKIRLVDEENIFIQTVDKYQKVSWQKVSEVSRHPSNGRLIKVTTNSGRSVSATLSHSFLKRNEKTKQIEAIKGSNLKIGDKIPIIKHSPYPPMLCDFNDNHLYKNQYFYEFIAILISCQDLVISDYKINFSSKLIYNERSQMDNYLFFAGDKIYILDSDSICIESRGMVDFIKNFMMRKESNVDSTIESKVESHSSHSSLSSIKLKIPEFFYMVNRDSLDEKTDLIGHFLNTFCTMNSYIETIDQKESITIFHSSKYILEQIAQLYQYRGTIFMLNYENGNHVLYLLSCSDKKNQYYSEYIFWDVIVDIQYIDTDKYVYDFSVNSTETFALRSGILVHNTLNSFHSAGLSIRTVVSGVPRFTELLNASKEPKNKSCQVFFKGENKNISELRNKIGHSIVSLTISGVVNKVGIFKNKKERWHKVFQSIFENKGDEDDEKDKKDTYCISIQLSRQKMNEYNLTLSYIAEKIQKEFQDSKCIYSPDYLSTIDIFVNVDKIPDEEKLIFLEDTCVPSIKSFEFTGISGITDIFYDKKGEEWYIDTEGSNIKSLFGHPHVDMTRTTSTNVWDIYHTLGIEAARKFLVEQFVNVISSDGTFVNNCHITLLVDIMTFSGMVVSISRYGLKKEACGPMAKASFEESLENFIKAGVFGETEKLAGVSANIIMGKQPKIGTGICDVFIDIKKLLNEPILLTDVKETVKEN